MTDCPRDAVKSCRVEWNSGSPDRFLKRTRFDGWSMSLCDEEGRVVLNVRDAQDFTRGRLHRLVDVLGVPRSAPDDWRDAQRRWLAIRMSY